MDGSTAYFFVLPGKCIPVPVPGKNVKMDAIQATIIPIPHSYDPAKDDIIGKFATLAYDLTKDSDQARTPLRCSSKGQFFHTCNQPVRCLDRGR